MARRRYYRVRRVYPKQKWLPALNELNLIGGTLPASQYVIRYYPLTENPSRTTDSGSGNISSATILKVGRFRFKGVMINPNTVGANVIVGIAYIPEGYTINIAGSPNGDISTLGLTFFYKHPELV